MKTAPRHRPRLLAAAAWLCAAQLALAASSRAPIGDGVASGVAGLLRAVPPPWRQPIGEFLSRASFSALDLRRSLDSAPGAALGAASQAQEAAQDDRALVASVAGDFLRRVDAPRSPSDMLQAAEKLAALERVLAPDLAAREQAPLIEALRLVSRRLSREHREILVSRVGRVADQLKGAASESAPAASRTGASRLLRPAPAAPAGRLEALNEITGAELRAVKKQIIEAAQEMHEEALIEGRGGMTPIEVKLFDGIYKADREYGLSQVTRDVQGRVIGFVLAYPNARQGTVRLEKIGVLREYRKLGLSKTMLRAVAEKAESYQVPLVDLAVVKTNSEAIPAYERLGFEDVTPEEVAEDPEYDAYHFVTPTKRLLQATGRPGASLEGVLARARTPAERIFIAAQPRSLAPEILAEYGLDFTASAAGMLEERDFLNITSSPFDLEEQFPWYAGPRLKGAIREIMSFADKAGEDRRALAFLTRLAGHLAADIVAKGAAGKFDPFRWPGNPLKTGEYWDLASGTNGGRWLMAGLDADTQYRLFDLSHFVVLVLKQVIKLAREQGLLAARVKVERADIRSLSPPKKPLAVLRVKNVEAYVSGGAEAVDKITAWLAEGGQLILQQSPNPGYQMRDIEAFGAMIERLMNEGWKFEAETGRRMGDGLDVDTIKLTKPPDRWGRVRRGNQAERSWRAWAEYKARVSERSQPMGIFILRI